MQWQRPRAASFSQPQARGPRGQVYEEEPGPGPVYEQMKNSREWRKYKSAHEDYEEVKLDCKAFSDLHYAKLTELYEEWDATRSGSARAWYQDQIQRQIMRRERLALKLERAKEKRDEAKEKWSEYVARKTGN